MIKFKATDAGIKKLAEIEESAEESVTSIPFRLKKREKCFLCGKGRWIKCSDRLPDKAGEYLVVTEYRSVKFDDLYLTGSWKHYDPTHWQPLPDLPEED